MWPQWLARAAIVALALCAGAGGTRAGLHAAPDLFDEIYRRSQPIDATLKTIDAAFTETTSSPLLAKPLVAEGTLHVVRPAQIELIYTSPSSRTITIKDGQLVVEVPGRGVHESRSVAEALARVDRYFVAKSPDELRRHFQIVAIDDPARAGTYRLDMTPRRKQIQQGLTRLELWLRQDTLLLDAMRMHFPGDSTKMMEFRNVQVNKPTSPAPPLRSGGAR